MTKQKRIEELENIIVKIKKDLYKIVDNEKRHLDETTGHEYIDTCETYKFLSRIH